MGDAVQTGNHQKQLAALFKKKKKIHSVQLGIHFGTPHAQPSQEKIHAALSL